MPELKSAKLLHGSDYNPDQWLDRPDILEEDIRLMQEAKVNCVTLGVFSWARLEPSEGSYDLGWLKRTMDTLYENGIYTILATPTGALPHWLTERYPETLKMSGSGLRRRHGQRHNFCPTSPALRERAHAIDTVLAKALGHHPGLIAWHISNEYGGDTDGLNDPLDGIGCHCPACEAAFRSWLKERYGTLEALNRAWWSSFWGNLCTGWEQIHAPGANGEHTLHGIKLDWKRFVSEQLLDFCKAEIRAVRAYSDAPVTSNLMGAFEPLDYFRWAKELDIVSLDSYPDWHSASDESDTAADAAFSYTLLRSLKKQPFLLMESVPSAVSWRPRCSLKRPGMHELSSLQAVACGSNSVQYFQWRKSRGASEKYHGAVIDHKNGSNTRVFRDVARLGERLDCLSETVLKTCNRPRAAIVFDWENWWAVEDTAAVVNPFRYLPRWMEHFRAFWRKGADVDIVSMDDDLSGYALVAAPCNYLYRGDYPETVRRYVQNGGTYVTTCWSGEADEHDLCYLESHPLRKVLGIRTEEIDVRPEHVANSVAYQGRSYAIKDLCALVHAESAEVLAVYEADFYAGYPALTRNRYGSGTAYFVAAECESAFLDAFYDRLLSETGCGCTLRAELPHGVSVNERRNADGSGFLWFVMNFNAEAAALPLSDRYRNAETGEALFGEVTLKPYECLILEKDGQ